VTSQSFLGVEDVTFPGAICDVTERGASDRCEIVSMQNGSKKGEAVPVTGRGGP
jgi:hypothetical protein